MNTPADVPQFRTTDARDRAYRQWVDEAGGTMRDGMMCVILLYDGATGSGRLEVRRNGQWEPA